MGAAPLNETCAVVVTYNRADMLEECVARLLAQEGAACDVLIVDNASTDGTGERAARMVDGARVRYLNTGENLGGAGGFRVGMEAAVLAGYRFVWAMDDDVLACPDSLRPLLEADAELGGGYGFLSGIADWRDGSPCAMNRQKVTLRSPIGDYESPLVPVIMATFVSFFVRSETVRRFGLPIKEFFIWADDLEYSRRISRELPCYAVNASHVLHNMASNRKVGIEAESADRLWRYEYLYRNEVYIYRREGARGWAYLLARVALHCARVVARGDDKRRKLGVVLGSFKKGLTFNPAVERVADGELRA